jgi:voltage-gated potassium channel
MTEDLSDHIIVCGFGTLGRAVARELQDADAAYVAIGSLEDSGPASTLGIRFVCGDPSSPRALLAAGLPTARAVVACAGTDAENIATTRAARELRPDIAVAAGLAGDEGEQRVRRAGASHVVAPLAAAGADLARRALYAGDGGQGEEYRIEELTVAAVSSGAGHAISALRGGAFVVGVRRTNGSFLPMPPGDTQLRPGDTVLALGTAETLARLERLLAAMPLNASSVLSSGLPRTTRRL